MLLRRRYEPIDPKKGREPANLKPAGVSVRHTGVKATQNFSRQLVEKAIAEGWMSLGKGRLVLHAAEGDLDYEVKRMPGTYCCHCGEKLPESKTAQAHVAEKHAGKTSPDRSNPSGYAVTHAYECVLDAGQQKTHGIEPAQMYVPEQTGGAHG